MNLKTDNKIRRFIKISRPKFWHYLGGPMALGLLAYWKNGGGIGLLELASFFWIMFLGNFFVYGINDWADRDTDQLNSKKNDLDEVKIRQEEIKWLEKCLLLVVISAVGLMAWMILAGKLIAASGVFLLLFFGWGYSAMPIRAKAKPFIDGLFNFLYIAPAIVGYGFGGQWVGLDILLAATLWCMAMHAFSAIPDIEPDRKVHLKTTAVVLGESGTLWYCLGCYIIGGMILNDWRIRLCLAAYALIILIILLSKKGSADKFYKYFPVVNLLMGAYLFLLMIW